MANNASTMMFVWRDSVPIQQGEYRPDQLAGQVSSRVRSVGFVVAEDENEVKLALNLKGDEPDAYIVSQVIVIPVTNIEARYEMIPALTGVDEGNKEKA